MFNQVMAVHRTFGPAQVEELADTLFEIGKDLAGKKQFDAAVPWLERALDVVPEQDEVALLDDSAELKIAILHTLVKSLLAQNKPDTKSRAQDLIDTMDGVCTVRICVTTNELTTQECQNKIVVWLLRLEVLSSEKDPDTQTYSNGRGFPDASTIRH